MTEFTEPFIEPEPQPHEVYETNEAMAESLQGYRARAEELTRREAFWRRHGLNIALGPLTSATLLLVSPVSEMINDNEKAAAGTSSLMATLLLGLVALHRHDKNREKAQGLAVEAAPIAHALNTGPYWIEFRLRQKEEDHLRVLRNTGINQRDT